MKTLGWLVSCLAIAGFFGGCDSMPTEVQTQPIIVTSLPIPHMEAGRVYIADVSLKFKPWTQVRVNGTEEVPTVGYIRADGVIVPVGTDPVEAQRAADEARTAWKK